MNGQAFLLHLPEYFALPEYASASDLEKELLLMVELSETFVLHPALQTSELQYQRRLASAIISIVLPPPINRAPVVRSLIRELLANCVRARIQ